MYINHLIRRVIIISHQFIIRYLLLIILRRGHADADPFNCAGDGGDIDPVEYCVAEHVDGAFDGAFESEGHVELGGFLGAAHVHV